MSTYTLSGQQLRERIEFGQLHHGLPSFRTISRKCKRGDSWLWGIFQAERVQPTTLHRITSSLELDREYFFAEYPDQLIRKEAGKIFSGNGGDAA